MDYDTPNTEKKHSFMLLKVYEIKDAIVRLLKNKFFYIGLLFIVIGRQLNFLSQSYLYQYVEQGKSLPVLSDLILDNLPYWDIDFLYDSFLLVGAFFFVAYIVHKRQYDRIPYILLIGGIYQMVRGVFIVLTPFGNPHMFDGTESLFNGFAKYELGVYPSGHTGIAFLYFLLTENKYYRLILMFCLLVIIAAMFLARGHYSIDILSALFFAYAIKAFGDKYLLNTFYKKPSLQNK